jgi:hypothetical protein
LSRDQHDRFVAHGEFVVSRGDGPVSFEAVDAAFDCVTFFVVALVELRWPATLGAKSPAVTDPIRRDWDGGLDSTPAQVGAVPSGIVRLVRTNPVRASARPTESEPGDPDRFQDRLELRGIAPLPGRDHDGQRLLALLDGKVNLAGQPAPGPAESVVGRLDEDAAGRFLLEIPLFAAPAAC